MSTKRSRPEAAKNEAMANQRSHSNTAAAQRQRMLKALRRGHVSTIYARRNLDILCPAARVLELRRAGYRIKTVWVWDRTDCGKSHRVALYVLARRG